MQSMSQSIRNNAFLRKWTFFGAILTLSHGAHILYRQKKRGSAFVEYIPIERSTDAFQQSIEQSHLIAMCRRAFGETIQIESAKELGGGLYNNTYLVHIVGMQPVILRVSPLPARQYRLERNLMRNEYMSLPFLAPIAPLLPRILMVDFTHQILDRDYLFQTYMEGEQWAQVMHTFTSEEQKMLWRQLGSITKKIHTIQGDHFGNVAFGSHFASWSLTVMDWLTTIIRDLEDAGLDTTDIESLLNLAQAHSQLLDEINRPQFLHGDLWTVNILVKRSEEGPKIVAVLDSDRTSWGDPMADWTIFLLHRNAGTEVDAFWETYGQPEKSLGTQVRMLLYQGRYIGGARLEHHRLHHHETVKRSYQDLQIIIEQLRSFPIDESSR
jgi:aminoglycoside phosphotransferase (APT) family kinase protein